VFKYNTLWHVGSEAVSVEVIDILMIPCSFNKKCTELRVIHDRQERVVGRLPVRHFSLNSMRPLDSISFM